MGNTGDCPNWCPLCSHPKRPCSISGCPSHFVSHPLSFHSVCLFIAVFLSSLILFVDVTPLCPEPLFRLCFLSLTAERKKSGSWHPKTHKVEMLNENTDKAKKKRKLDAEGQIGRAACIFLYRRDTSTRCFVPTFCNIFKCTRGAK